MTPSPLADIVKAYDVRGLVGSQLDEAVAAALGTAFAEVVVRPEGASDVVIGYDMRESSPGLSAAFAKGLAERGCNALMMGLTSTDGLYFASGQLSMPGAMFTASHNPAAYNGIKLCRSGARPVGRPRHRPDRPARARRGGPGRHGRCAGRGRAGKGVAR